MEEKHKITVAKFIVKSLGYIIKQIPGILLFSLIWVLLVWSDSESNLLEWLYAQVNQRHPFENFYGLLLLFGISCWFSLKVIKWIVKYSRKNKNEIDNSLNESKTKNLEELNREYELLTLKQDQNEGRLSEADMKRLLAINNEIKKVMTEMINK